MSNGRLKDTKTGKVRSVRLLAPLADDLRDWRKATDHDHDTDDALIFARPDGHMWNTDDWKNWTSRTFHRACINLKLGQISIATLRAMKSTAVSDVIT